MRTFYAVTASLTVLLVSSAAAAATLKVGPSEAFTKPCMAITAPALMDGDTIEIDASMVYTKDYCALDKNNITIKAVGAGRAKIDAMLEGVEMLPDNAIWTLNGDNTTIEGIEFTGAAAAGLLNGTGVHVVGSSVTIRNSSFHDNQYGVRVDDNATSVVLIETSEFGFNGTDTPFGDNITVGNVLKFTLQNSYSHHARGGNLVTSYAVETHILSNRLSDESNGNAQFQLDLPVGGRTYVLGNIFHKGVMTDAGNNKMISYAESGVMLQPDQDLFVVNNTLVSDKMPGTIFIDASTPANKPPVVRNNIFVGPGTPCTVTGVVGADNITTGDPLFEDPATYDYHLKAGSPAIDMGVAPGMGLGVDLTPKTHYVHTAMSEVRPENGAIDIGAYEVPPPVGPTGSGGAGGAGGTGAGGDPAAGSGGMGAASTGAGTGGTGGVGDDPGCDCRAGASGSSTGGVLAALGLAVLSALAGGGTAPLRAFCKHGLTLAGAIRSIYVLTRGPFAQARGPSPSAGFHRQSRPQRRSPSWRPPPRGHGTGNRCWSSSSRSLARPQANHSIRRAQGSAGAAPQSRCRASPR
jgi:hypothetical protein